MFVDGAVVLKDQLRDYQYRGPILNDLSFFDFVVNTYDKAEHAQEEDLQEETSKEKKKAGRPKNLRVPYLPEAGKPNSCRVLRTNGHETIPKISGAWVASGKDKNNREFYSASMLLMFKPWRTLKNLKDTDELFEASWGRLQQSLSAREKQLVENFEYYHDCWEAASHRRDMERAGEEIRQFDFQPPGQWQDDDFNLEEDAEEGIEDEFWIPQDITEEMIEEARGNQVEMRETVFANNALEEAYGYGIFTDEIQADKMDSRPPLAKKADREQRLMIDDLDAQLKRATREQIARDGILDIAALGTQKKASDQVPKITTLANANENGQNPSSSASEGSQPNVRPLLKLLNRDQRRAHDLVENKLVAHLRGKSIKRHAST